MLLLHQTLCKHSAPLAAHLLQDALTDRLSSAAAEAWHAGQAGWAPCRGALALVGVLNAAGAAWAAPVQCSAGQLAVLLLRV